MAADKKRMIKKLTTTCYVALQPQYTRGELKGIKAPGAEPESTARGPLREAPTVDARLGVQTL